MKCYSFFYDFAEKTDILFIGTSWPFKRFVYTKIPLVRQYNNIVVCQRPSMHVLCGYGVNKCDPSAVI